MKPLRMERLTNKGDTYSIVSMKLFSSQSSNTHTHQAILVEAHNGEVNAMLDSLLTVNPDDSSFLLMIVVESEILRLLRGVKF